MDFEERGPMVGQEMTMGVRRETLMERIDNQIKDGEQRLVKLKEIRRLLDMNSNLTRFFDLYQDLF